MSGIVLVFVALGAGTALGQAVKMDGYDRCVTPYYGSWECAPVPADHVRVVTQPTGLPPAPDRIKPDRRPVEQNPTCWIASPGWPRCSERTDTP